MKWKSILMCHLYYLIYLIIIHLSFYGQSVYYLLFINTLLALIPIEISLLLISFKNKKIEIPLFFAWLAFLPNNFYLITDLFHISLMQPYDTTTALIKLDNLMWFKLMMIFIGIFPTLFLGCWSIKVVSEKIVSYFSIKIRREIIYCVILFLNAIGIYLGRFERLNTWDTLTNPHTIFQAIINIFTTDGAIKFILQFFLFSVVFMVAYHLIININQINQLESPSKR